VTDIRSVEDVHHEPVGGTGPKYEGGCLGSYRRRRVRDGQIVPGGPLLDPVRDCWQAEVGSTQSAVIRNGSGCVATAVEFQDRRNSRYDGRRPVLQGHCSRRSTCVTDRGVT
jgi:hypothetical protein